MGSITISPLNAKVSYVSHRDPFVEKMAVALCVCVCVCVCTAVSL